MNFRIIAAALFTVAAFSAQVWAGPGESQPAPRVLTLEEAVQIALEQNPDILKAKQEIERTYGVVMEVRAQALPQITANGSYQYQGRDVLAPSGDSNGGSAALLAAGGGNAGASNSGLAGLNSRGISEQDKMWRVGVSFRQLVYSGGQVGSAIKIAKFARDSSFYQLRDTVDRVIEEVRTEFYRVLLNKALIEVELETTELLRQELRDQQNRFEAGTVPRFNVLRAEVELANAQPALISARNNYRIAQYQLMKTLGLAYVPGLTSAPLELVGELPYVPRKVDLSAAVAQALASRPFLAVQRATILSEEQQVRVARGGYLPTVSLVSGYDARNETGARSTSDAQDSWYAGVEGQWRIFDGFETRGKVKQALARLETARINYEDSVRQVELEVQQAVSSLQEAEELIESQRKNVEQATEALRLARERLSAGAGTQLEVLDARVALTRAQVTEVEARYRYNQALANLDRVTASNTVYHASLLGTDGRTVETIKVEKVDKLSK